jgi:hypothetical protein
MTHATVRRVVALVMLLGLGLAGVPLLAQSKQYDPPLTAGKERVYTAAYATVVDAIRKTVSTGPREMVREENAGADTLVVNARYRPSFSSSRPAYAGQFRAVVESKAEGKVAVRIHWPANPGDADLIFRDLETLLPR